MSLVFDNLLGYFMSMRRRILFTILLASLAAAFISAKDRITILGGEMDLGCTINASYYPIGGLSLDGGFTLTPKNSYEWTAFLGQEELTREQFFKITGCEELRLFVEKGERKERFMNITGYSLFTAGSALTLTSLILYASANEFMTENIYPFVASGIGVVMLSLPFISYEFEDGVNISCAIQIADAYNMK